jgi:hypothetical protein
MIGDEKPPPQVKIGDMATHGGDIRLIDHLTKYRSPKERALIDRLFAKLSRGDKTGLERSLRNKDVASLRRRGVLTVERE